MKFIKNSLLVVAFAASAFLASAISPQKSHAVSYTVAVTTYVPTDSTNYTQGAYPNISGNLYLRQLVLSNNSATAQTITVYTTCTSTSAAAVAFKVDLPATIGTYYFPSGNVVLPKDLPLASPCITRSATTGITQATFLYE